MSKSMHLLGRQSRITACGRWFAVYASRDTGDVTCLQCLRTRRYQARKANSQRIRDDQENKAKG